MASTSTKLIQGTLWLLYPMVIYFGLQFFQPRYVALLLGLGLLLRRRRAAGQLLRELSHVDRAVLVALLTLAGVTALTNSETLLRLYPAAVSLGMLLLFGLSLKYPPSIVERFARLDEPALPPDGVRYTRRVTQVWCVFFVINGCIAGVTAVAASRDAWALYNGLIAYVLMGLLFGAEWLVRRGHLARRALR